MQQLMAIRGVINRELEIWADEALPEWKHLIEPIRYAVLGSGKRVRPSLLVATWDAVRSTMEGGNAEPTPADEIPRGVCRIACAIEIVHVMTLIQDDLPCMDDDDLRRGRPSLHIQFDEVTTILASTAMVPMAMAAVVDGAEEMGLGSQLAGRLVAELSEAMGAEGTIGGQVMDFEAEGKVVDEATLERIQIGKTATLIAVCCKMGAIAASAPEDLVARVDRFGRGIGLAFQVIDDILDLTASTEQLGKPQGRDEELEKATWPSLLGLDGARRRANELGRSAIAELEPLSGAHVLRDIGRLVLERTY